MQYKEFEIEPHVGPLQDRTFAISANIWRNQSAKANVQQVEGRVSLFREGHHRQYGTTRPPS